MMTVAEAIQRMQVNKAGMRVHHKTYIVYLYEWARQEYDERAYTTDDLEDAVIAAGKLRRAA